MNLPAEQPVLSPRQKYILIAGIALAMILPALFSRLLLLVHLDNVGLLVASRFIYWSIAGLLCLYAIKVERQPFILWHQYQPVEFYLKWAVLLYLLCLAASIISAIPNLFHMKDDMTIMYKWIRIIVNKYWLLLFCAVTAGITEELICRAYIVPRLQQLFKNNYLPVLLSAAIFSALHYRYFSLRETIFTFLIGVIFAVHYQRYKNIHVLILVHFMVDFFSFLLARYAVTHHLDKFALGIW